MSLHRWTLLILALGLFALTGRAQPAAEPLPAGAKLRLGTTRMRDSGQWTGAVLSPDGTHLIGSTLNGFVEVDVTTGVPSGKAAKAPGTGFSRNELNADGSRFASVTYTGVIVWDRTSGATLAKIDRRLPYDGGGTSLSGDGKLLAIGGVREDMKKDSLVNVLVWDLEKKEKRFEIPVLQNQSGSVMLSANGTRLATWGTHFDQTPPGGRPDPSKDYGRFVQFWDAASGKELGRVRIEGYGTPIVAFSPDGKIAAVGSSSSTVQLIDPQTGTVQRQLFGRASNGSRIAFSPDGKLIASASTDATVQIWQVADGKTVSTTESPFAPLVIGVREVRFTGPDRAVVWFQFGATAVVWEVPSGKLLSPVGGHTGAVTSVAFASGGKEVLSGGQDGLILRWDAATGKALGELPLAVSGGRTTYGSVAFNSSGSIAVVDRFGRAIYDLATGKQIAGVPNLGNSSSLLASDSRTLLMVPSLPFGMEAPKTIQVPVWDMATGIKLAELELPAGEVVGVAVTPDRSKLVTALRTRAGKDGKSDMLITGWDLTANGKKLGELTEKAGFGAVQMMAAPDNTSVLLGTSDDRLVQIDATTGKAVREMDASRMRVTAVPVFAPDGKTFAVGLGAGFATSGGTIRIYDAASGKTIRTLKGHTGQVSCLAFSPDGKTLASGSTDTTVLLWDVAAKE